MEKGTLVTASKTGGPGGDPVPTGQRPEDGAVKDQARGTRWERGWGLGGPGQGEEGGSSQPERLAGVLLSLAGQGQTPRCRLPQWPHTGACGGLHWTVGLGMATCPRPHTPITDRVSCLLLSPLRLCPGGSQPDPCPGERD